MQKIRFKTLLAVIVAIVFSINTACTNDEPSTPTDREIAFEKLAGNWVINVSGGGIFLDSEDVSLNYSGFTLSFDDGTYQTINGGELFSASGTWEFITEDASMLSLDTGEEIIVIDLTETRFEFSFSTNGNGGVAAGIGGNYVIIAGR